MFGTEIRLTKTLGQLERAKKKGAYKTLRHAAFSIRKTAIQSMIFAKGPSKPGTPPHAHAGRIRRSIMVAEDEKGGEVVGPSYNRVKAGGRPPWLAEMLEKGGTFQRRKKRARRGRPRKGEAPQPAISVTYPARPFMQPALERNLARFHRDWKGAI